MLGHCRLSAGVASFEPVSSLHAGARTVKAVYSGDAGFQGGSDSITQDVEKGLAIVHRE